MVQGRKISRQELISGLREAANILGHSPSRPEFNELDDVPSANAVVNEFGSWNGGKKAAGLDTVGAGGALSVNESYFKELDTPEKAYWIGFLYGDGCVFQREKGSARVSLGLKHEDEKHVRKFKSAIDSKHAISKSDSLVGISIQHAEFSEAVAKHGLTTEKTYSDSLPTLEHDDLRAAFVRGLFDADGHSGVNHRFNITGSNRDRFARLIEWLPVDGTVQDRGDGVFTLRVGSKARLRELYSWLYPTGEATTPALDRKLKKIPTKWIQKKSKSISPK